MCRFDVMKKCNKCQVSKPTGEFYSRHRSCKDCVKKASKERRAKLLNDPLWVQKERERCRIKQENYRKLGLDSPPKPEVRKDWARRNRIKRRAQCAAQRALIKGLLSKPASCSECGKVSEDLEKHHPDYSQPLMIQWLCTACHGLTRRKIAA